MNDATTPPEIAAVSQSLNRVLDSTAFAGSERQRQLLRYLVSEELEGRGDRIKAVSIAQDVLGRGADFDPQQDSIVRVEVGRLRQQLALFYGTDGRDEPLRIGIPKGSYRPLIGYGELGGELAEGAHARAPNWRLISWVALGVVTAMLLGLFWLTRSATPPVRREVVNLVVLPVRVQSALPNVEVLGPGLQASLAAALSDFDQITVSVSPAARPSLPNMDYALDVTITAADGQAAATVLILDARTSELRQHERFQVQVMPGSLLDLKQALVERIAVAIGRPFGRISVLEQARLRREPTGVDAPYRCVLLTYRYWATYARADHAAAIDCMGRHVPADSTYSDGLAMRAFLELDIYRYGFGGSGAGGLEQTGQLAARALQLAPEATLATLAHVTAQLCRGDAPGAEVKLVALAARQRNNPLVLSDVAAKLALDLGRFEVARPYHQRAAALNAAPQDWYALVPFVEAMRTGDVVAIQNARAMLAASRMPSARLLAFIGAAQAGQAGAVAQERAQLEELGYVGASSISGLLERSCWMPAVRERLTPALQKGLGQAG
jgi:adenylate cyclase